MKTFVSEPPADPVTKRLDMLLWKRLVRQAFHNITPHLLSDQVQVERCFEGFQLNEASHVKVTTIVLVAQKNGVGLLCFAVEMPHAHCPPF